MTIVGMKQGHGLNEVALKLQRAQGSSLNR